MVHIYKSPIGQVKDLYWGNAASFIADAPQVRRDPNKLLYVDAKTGQGLTASESVDFIARFHNVFRTKIGLKYDEVACLFVKNSIYLPMIHLGILSLGGIVSPASIAYMPKDLAHQLRLTGAKVVVTIPELRATVTEAIKEEGVKVEKIVLLQDVINDAIAATVTELDTPVPLPGGLAREKVAYYSSSSGTSGVPKGVVSSHTNLTSNCQQQTQASFGFYDPANVYVAVLPMSHIFGLAKFVFTTFYNGSTCVVHDQFEMEAYLQSIIKYKITHTHLVPPIIVQLAKNPIVDRYIDVKKSLRYIMSGAAPLSTSTIDQVQSRLGVEVKQGYGLTESSPVSHFFAYNADTYNTAGIGWLVPGMEARLVDDDGHDVPVGHRGELWIRGANIMMGYLRNPVATADTLTSDGFLKTGDIATVDPDGQFFIVDRKKELIKSKGHQVAPAELESILLQHDQVVDAAVTGVYNEDEQTELPRAYIVLRSKSHDPLDIKRWFDSEVARHKRLWGGIVVLEQIPKNPSGKILRRHLRENVKNDIVLGFRQAKL